MERETSNSLPRPKGEIEDGGEEKESGRWEKLKI